MRPADWPARLSAEIRAARDRPFAWGTHDCFTWAVRVVLRLGGPDLAALAGSWTDEESARTAILARGGDLAESVAWAAEQTGMQEVPPALAQRGDLVMLRTPQGPLCAICVGQHAMAAAQAGGVIPLPMSIAMRAWAV